MIEPILEIECYFAGIATEEQLLAVEAWIRADPAHAKAFMEQLHFREVVGQHLRERVDHSSLALAELARLEEQAESVAVTMHHDTSSWRSQNATGKQWRAAAAYLFEHAFTPKRLAVIATAAAVLLGAVITVVLLSGPGEVEPVAELPDTTPTTPSSDPYRVVATVTDQVNAQWVTANGQGALPDRMLLAINQRLTLAQGFAEITTKRGAKVLVQAPATIETTDSGNAIRLHRGK
ncbi:MAG: hypothetical protein AAGB26_15825, partial [Planctomycetota bacterium]